MATTVLLLRHAAHDRLGELCGRLPGVALGPAGLAQADALGRRLRREGLAALYTSPVQRCRETAAAIGARTGLTPRIEPAAIEIDFGRWTGQRFADLDRDPAWTRWNEARDQETAPGGESMAAAQARMVALMAVLRERHEGARVGVVSHADVIKAAVCACLGLSLRAHAAFEVAPASLTTLVLWQGGGKVVGLNEMVAEDAARSERAA